MTNPATHALEEGLEKVGTSAGKDAVNALETVMGDTEKGLVQSAKNHVEHDAAREAELKAIAAQTHKVEDLRANLGPSPVYHIRPDGQVMKLTEQGPKSLEKADRQLLGKRLKLDENDRIREPELEGDKKPYGLPPVPRGTTRPKIPSEQVPFDHDELSRATQLARHEDESYGTYKKVGEDKYDFSANNYAAARYGEEGDPDGFIMVARSDPRGLHSERNLGIPFLEGQSADGLTALYTEREPCSTRANCSAWMHEYLPGVNVTHTVEYGATKESQAAGNRLMEDYLNGLRPKPANQYVP